MKFTKYVLRASLYRGFKNHWSREWQRKLTARILHIPGCICRFASGFCKNTKKKTETLYQSFSPFMGEDSKIDTIPPLSFCNTSFRFVMGTLGGKIARQGCRMDRRKKTVKLELDGASIINNVWLPYQVIEKADDILPAREAEG